MDEDRLLDHKLRSNLQRLGLVAALAGLLGGATFAWATLGAILLLYWLNPAGSPRLLSLDRARPILPDQAQRLDAILPALVRRAGLGRVPLLYHPTTFLIRLTAPTPREAELHRMAHAAGAA